MSPSIESSNAPPVFAFPKAPVSFKRIHSMSTGNFLAREGILFLSPYLSIYWGKKFLPVKIEMVSDRHPLRRWEVPMCCEIQSLSL